MRERARQSRCLFQFIYLFLFSSVLYDFIFVFVYMILPFGETKKKNKIIYPPVLL